MRTVWKYLIPFRRATFAIQKGSEFLGLAEQNGLIALWFLIDTARKRESRSFVVVRTGLDDVPDGATYRGTALFQDGVELHVFETPGPEAREQEGA